MQVWYRDCALRFQRNDAGLFPATCSKQYDPNHFNNLIIVHLGFLLYNTKMTSIIPTARQMRYFNIAKNNGSKSTYTRLHGSRVAIGAAIVNGNYVVSTGHNKRKTHTLQHSHNCYTQYKAPSPNIHAEIDALIYSRYNDLSGCEVFVYRELNNGLLGDCRPCKACMNALKHAGIKHIYYTSEQGYHYERI